MNTTATTTCRWPACGDPVQLNRRGASLGYCRRHFRWNAARFLRGLTYAEYEATEIARRVGDDGYAQVHVEGRWRAEHRVVMERIIGRPMRRGESVHHRNGIRSDNRPENLELWVGPVRAGQRAVDVRCSHCGTSYWDTEVAP